MRNIRVTFRAVFEQPNTGILNPMGVILPGPFPTEIYRTGEKWSAREIASRKRRVYEKLGYSPTLEIMQNVVEQSFARKVQDWQVWGTPPNEPAERLLAPDEVCDRGKGDFGWYTVEDFTHILHAPTIPAGARIPPAACGAAVKADCFVNNHANIAPSCKACEEIWEREYKTR